MTSTRAPIDPHADSELHRRIHAESPYWDMMYKAMLDQLTDYIDLAVAQALDQCGLHPASAAAPLPPARTAGRSTARPAAETTAIPPWLQPFVPSEKVRFTRTPDSLLRHEPRSLPPAEMPVEAPARAPDHVAFDPDLPAWRRPFTLPPNVRINRGPQRRAVEDQAPVAGSDAPDAPRSPAPAPSAEAASPAVENGVPGWFGIIRAAPAPILPVDEQDNSALPVEALEGSADLSTDDVLAEAWLASHSVRTEAETERPAAVDEVAVAADVPPTMVLSEDHEDSLASLQDRSDAFSIEETVLALLDHALDPGRTPSPPILLLPPPASLLPEAATTSWLDLVEPATVAVEAVSADAASPDPAPPLRPTGIASPEDARAFSGPARSSGRRRGTPAGLAPFESVAAAAADPDSWEDPPVELLVEPPTPEVALDLSSGALEQNARLLEGVLEEFGVRGEIIDVRPGPVVTLYELEPAPGTKSSRVIGLSDDIARSMSAVSARVAVVQGRNVIGIELPNQRRETVFLRELIASQGFTDSKHKLAIALGKTIGGEEVIVDLARMPHLLVAGTTGSGKSVAINTMILSILYRLRPDQ
ncbi:MAG TPA: DNA translocase FtsK, partial [Lichenihabitans sp.]|nr:DNA translocase FtsK [Lichenihabitans sp.]